MKQLHSYRYVFVIIVFCLAIGSANSQTTLTCADLGGVGDLDARCILSNNTFTVSDGDVISGTGILELGNHGELKLGAGKSFFIDMDGDVFIQNGGRIYGNVEITCANLYVDGAINSAAKGYTSSKGPGAGEDGVDSTQGGGGAGFGGNGGVGLNNASGGGNAYQFKITEPKAMGSGGGEQQFWFTATGGNGGGKIKVTVTGAVTVNGTIGSNGDVGFCMGPKYCSGGGSGGSIWIQSNSLTGTGSITANGGNGGIGTFAGGGGGGGRIALYFSNNSFKGSITAIGGFGVNSQSGGAGTVYKNNGTATSLTIGNKSFYGALTPIDLSITQEFTNVLVRNGARLHPYGTVNTVIKNFTIASEGTVESPSSTSSLNLSVNKLSIETGGLINYDGSGHTSASGAGMGGSVNNTTEGAGGGAHAATGGTGENSGGAGGIGGYGDEYQPVNYGSGGGNINSADTTFGGNGGGAIWLNVTKELMIDGKISAKGLAGSTSSGSGAGGGAGGSIVLCAETISGSGIVTVAGGAGGDDIYDGGGGSGGRLAMYTQNMSFTGSSKVRGGNGNGAGDGEDGSLVLETECGTPPILIDIDKLDVLKIDEFKIYPNPNTGSFNVDLYLAETKDVIIKVINLIGQEVYWEELLQVDGYLVKSMTLEPAPAGIYYIHIITDRIVFNKKIVLQK